ncbi:hypothetical protein SprV_0802545500 [Sparganum proliferum]
MLDSERVAGYPPTPRRRAGHLPTLIPLAIARLSYIYGALTDRSYGTHSLCCALRALSRAQPAAAQRRMI